MANLYQIKASESITDDLAAYDLMLRTLASWLAEDNLYDGDEALIKAFQQICTTWKNEAYPITQDFAMVASAFDRHPHTAHNVFDQQPQQDNTEMSFTALENYEQIMGLHENDDTQTTAPTIPRPLDNQPSDPDMYLPDLPYLVHLLGNNGANTGTNEDDDLPDWLRDITWQVGQHLTKTFLAHTSSSRIDTRSYQS